MTTSRWSGFTGVTLGFLTSLIFSVLFLPWPTRTCGGAVLLSLAGIFILRREVQPTPSRAHFVGAFFLGYAAFTLLLVLLEFIFPPLT